MGSAPRAPPRMVRAGSVTWAEKLEESCVPMHSPHHSSSHIHRTCLKEVRATTGSCTCVTCSGPSEPLQLCADQGVGGGPVRKGQLDFRHLVLCRTGAVWALSRCLGTPPSCLPRVQQCSCLLTHAVAALATIHTCLLCRGCPTSRTAPKRTLRSLQTPARGWHITGRFPSELMAA